MTTYTGADHNEIVRSGLPQDAAQLYLVKRRGEWPVYAATSESGAIEQAKALDAQRVGDVRIFRVLSAELGYLELQREIVRERLVPKGEAVLH